MYTIDELKKYTPKPQFANADTPEMEEDISGEWVHIDDIYGYINILISWIKDTGRDQPCQDVMLGLLQDIIGE